MTLAFFPCMRPGSNAGGSCSPGGPAVAHRWRGRSLSRPSARPAAKLTMYSHIIKGRRRRRRRTNATEGAIKAQRTESCGNNHLLGEKLYSAMSLYHNKMGRTEVKKVKDESKTYSKNKS